MKSKPTTKTVEELLQLKTANMLYPNPEYQRGAVWTPAQEEADRLGFSRLTPPLIYLHHISLFRPNWFLSHAFSGLKGVKDLSKASYSRHC
jgi:hypothetical protein